REPELKGRLSASLDMEGNWDDPASRRGRGDVQVGGKNLYRIPVVLGLLQIANLSLPISSPFTEATTRYMVQGQNVTFDNISLRSSNMVMQGTGSLDFNSRKVELVFTTDNPNWPKLPFIQDLIEGARHELLQIHVRGTIQDPKVSATAMNTVTTTVEEVFREK
ncbi:MAG: AsmA-like C-terminal domain-containing protein, partial [Phycisphaerales bacterium]|nr:AsmA-like C-terminal domain-containing protein [Phycisphaerales bacterium]